MAVVELERRDHIALLSLNRPEARNAVSPEVSETMATLLDEIEADADLRAVVLTGRGEVFSAGADLKVVAQGRANDIARGKGGFAGIVTRNFPKPLIAAVNGPALAGGFEIVLSCDLVVSVETARFGSRMRPPAAAISPRFTSGIPNLAWSAATTRSHDSTISNPPASAGPLTAAINGLGKPRVTIPPKPPRLVASSPP
jgi:1,4-dihydroxy-2-naphthoyl-CoA synthase